MNLEKLTKEILSQSYNITTEAGEELTVIESGDVFDIIKRLASDGDLADVVGRSEQFFCNNERMGVRCVEQCLGCFQFENKD